ncbi:hypothetical protein FB451DRAFT_1416985 [Mycena latifolia]|nr:hypothetical protein FB451DRAFT_1416985 [Mycena latifolia]
MLDTTRAVSTSTRHNAFKFDDHSISNAPYNAIAHAYRFDAPTFMNWLDPGCVAFLLHSHSIFCIVQASADPAVSPRVQAHVICMQLDAERIKGEGQSASVVSMAQCARCVRPYRSPSQHHFDVVQRHPSRTRPMIWSSSTLAAPVLRRCESASRRGCDLELGLRSQIASISNLSTSVILSRTGGNAPTAILSDRPFLSQHVRIRRLRAEYECVSPPLPFLALLFSLHSLLSCSSLVAYMLTSSSAILRARTLPYAPRSFPPRQSVVSTTWNAMRSATTKPLPACSMRPAPTTSPHARDIAPDAVPRPHPQHQAPAQATYDTQQALPFLDTRAALADPADANDDLQREYLKFDIL